MAKFELEPRTNQLIDRDLEMKLMRKLSKASEGFRLDKDMKVAYGGVRYNARSEEAVLTALKPVFRKNGLYFYISNINPIFVNENYFKVIITIRLYDLETGYYIEFQGAGTGYDSVDKDSGKAITYAKKTALLHLLSVTTGEDTDNIHSNEHIGIIKEQIIDIINYLFKVGYFHGRIATETGLPVDSTDVAKKAIETQNHKIQNLKQINDIKKLKSHMEILLKIKEQTKIESTPKKQKPAEDMIF